MAQEQLKELAENTPGDQVGKAIVFSKEPPIPPLDPDPIVIDTHQTQVLKGELDTYADNISKAIQTQSPQLQKAILDKLKDDAEKLEPYRSRSTHNLADAWAEESERLAIIAKTQSAMTAMVATRNLMITAKNITETISSRYPDEMKPDLQVARAAVADMYLKRGICKTEEEARALAEKEVKISHIAVLAAFLARSVPILGDIISTPQLVSDDAEQKVRISESVTEMAIANIVYPNKVTIAKLKAESEITIKTEEERKKLEANLAKLERELKVGVQKVEKGKAIALANVGKEEEVASRKKEKAGAIRAAELNAVNVIAEKANEVKEVVVRGKKAEAEIERARAEAQFAGFQGAAKAIAATPAEGVKGIAESLKRLADENPGAAIGLAVGTIVSCPTLFWVMPLLREYGIHPVLTFVLWPAAVAGMCTTFGAIFEGFKRARDATRTTSTNHTSTKNKMDEATTDDLK